MLKYVLCVCGVLLISGCSSLSGWLGESKSQGYEFKGGKALEVPPDLSASALQKPSLDATRYSLFSQGQSEAQGDTKVLPRLDGLRLKKAGGVSWLEVDKPAAVVFGEIRAFLLGENYPLVVENPALGVLETDWVTKDRKLPATGIMSWFESAVNKDGNALIRDRYIVRVDYGDTPDKSEIYVSHRAIERVIVKQGNKLLYEESQDDLWVPVKPDPVVEAKMLGQLMIGMGSDQILAKETAEQMVEQAESKANDPAQYLVKNNEGYFQLIMPEGTYYDAWRLLSIGLDRAGFTVEDRDRFAGKTYVLFDKSVEKLNRGEKSFWDRFKFWDDDQEYDGELIVLSLDRRASPTVLTVLDKDEQPAPEVLAKRVLEIVNSALR